MRRFAGRRSFRVRGWKPGISIVVLHGEAPALRVRECLKELIRIAPLIGEPYEIVLLRTQNAARADKLPLVRSLAVKSGSGFVGLIKRAVRAVRFDWVYFLDAGMEPDPQTIPELLRWRTPNVFAVASRIVGAGTTGWKDARNEGDAILPFDTPPEESALTRGHLYADHRAALFRRTALMATLAHSDAYLSPHWNCVEWGVRAWRMGQEVLFCPRSTVRQAHATAPEIARVDRLQFDLRNAWTGVKADRLVAMLLQGDPKTHAALWGFQNAWRVLLARLKAYAAPVSDIPWGHLRQKYYPTPWNPDDRRKTLLVVAPYAVFPPTHGGAHRLNRLLEHAAREYQVILLGDEGRSYGALSEPYFAHLRAVHLVEGRKEGPGCEPARIARIRSHSNQVLGQELDRIVRVYRPDLVQIEHIELAGLAQWRRGVTPWILTLHDVLLSGAHQPSEEDAFERQWMSQFDLAVACCEEDAALLAGVPVRLVPNGAALQYGDYTPSAGLRDLLFLGPFRYQPNWEGILEFLRHAYPALRSRIEHVRLHVLGGVNARQRACGEKAFHQPGVCVHDQVADVRPWLKACALTINPIRNNRGACLKLIESLAAGRVCVSTRDGARGFLNRGLRGLVAVESVHEFIDPITRLLSDEDRRLELERPEPEKLEPYQWRHAATRQLAIYRELLDGGKGHAQRS